MHDRIERGSMDLECKHKCRRVCKHTTQGVWSGKNPLSVEFVNIWYNAYGYIYMDNTNLQIIPSRVSVSQSSRQEKYETQEQ